MGWLNKMMDDMIRTTIKIHEMRKAERNRNNIPCNFNDGITYMEFQNIVNKSVKHVKRIHELSIKGAKVYGEIRSQSGCSFWHFVIDFNDYGHLTGKYSLFSENSDSNIPNYIAENIKNLVLTQYGNATHTDFQENTTDNKKYSDGKCLYCGKTVKDMEAKYCPYCGGQLYL